MPTNAIADTTIESVLMLHRRDRNNKAITMLNLKAVTWSLGIFTAISFVFCVIYGLIVPPSLHMGQALEAVLPAFKWLSFPGFLLGLLESFLYGVYVGLVFVPIYNAISRRCGAPAPAPDAPYSPYRR